METFKNKNTSTGRDSLIRPADIANLRELELLKASGLLASFVTNGFFVKKDDMQIKILYEGIIWVEADGNYSHFHFRSNQPLTVVHNIGRVEEILPVRYFTRINKSEIVNLHYVDKCCGNLIYINNRSFSVAANCRDYVFSCFNVLIRKK